MEDVSMSGMFGWIEAGGATTGYNTFTETQSSDVIFRTTTLSNMIAIGNSNDATAAIYVRENKVGINRTPDSNNHYGLDVYGVQRFSNSNTYPGVYHDILACHSNVNFYSHVSTDDYDKDHPINQRQQTMSLNCLGELKNRLIISDYYAMTRNKVEDVPVKGFYAMPDYVKNGYKLITDASYEKEFLENEIFEVQTTKFKIDSKNVDANSNLNLDISVVLAEQSFMPLPIASGENIDIQFYKNNNVPDVQLFKEVIALEHVVENITILSYAFVDDMENTISFDMVVKDNNSFMFNTGSYYHVRNVNSAESRAEDIRNILMLKNVERLTSAGDLHSIRASFAHPDPMASLKRDLTPIISQFDKSSSINVYLFPLELPPLRDGLFAPQKYAVHITSTDNVVDDKHMRYTIESENVDLVNRVFNPKMRQNFAKDFMMIQEIQSDYTGIWSIEEVSITSQNTCEMSLRAVTLKNLDQNKRVYDQSRPVSIVPFRLCEFNRIGGPSVSHVSYIPPTERLAVGTFEAGETLTVGGAISLFDHIYFQNRDSKHPFRVHYSNESLVMELDNNSHQVSKHVRFSNNVEDTQNDTDAHVTFNGRVLFESNDDTAFYNRVVFSHPHDDEHLECDHFGVKTKSACNVVNTSMDTFGCVSTKFLGLDDMRYKQNTIQDVFIHDILFDQEFIDADNMKITHGVILETFADYMMDIQVHDIVRVFGSLFHVHIVKKKDACEDQLIQIFLSWYFEEERIHLFQSKNGQSKRTSLFQKQASAQIQVYRLIASRSNFKTCVRLDIRDIHFEKDKRDQHIVLKLLCIMHDHNPFLCIDRFFSFKTSSYALHGHDTDPLDNVVLLKAIKRRGANEYELEFRAVDNITDLKNDTVIPRYLDRENKTYLIPLHSFYEADKGQLPHYALREFQFPYPRYTEKNVNVGFSTEEDGLIYLNVRNSKRLDEHISSRAKFKVSAIDRVILENGIFEISKLYHFQDHVRAGIKFINNNYIVTKNNTAITYSFNGIPLGVKRANFTNTRHSAIIYADIDRNLFYLLRLYKGHYLYIMDKYNWIWKLVDICESKNQDEFILTLTTAHRIDEIDRQDFNTERHIFIIPLRFFTHHALVDDYQYAHVENYIPSRLGVNTTFITETMTVNGDMSCRDKLTFQNEDSLEPFHVKYDKDELNLNDQFLLSGEMAKCKSDLVVDGVLSVREVLTSSDRRLKCNIQDTCPLEDLQKINTLDIKSFTFLLDGLHHQHPKAQTGVIAQEIMDLFPNAVVEKRGIIPNIFKKGRVESHPNTLYITCTDAKNARDILTSLRDASQDEQHVKVAMICLSDEKELTVVLRDAYQEQGGNRLVLDVFEALHTYDAYFIKGTIGTLKMIHQQELFMTGLNAIKALSAEVEQLKNKTILSSTK